MIELRQFLTKRKGTPTIVLQFRVPHRLMPGGFTAWEDVPNVIDPEAFTMHELKEAHDAALTLQRVP